MRGRRTKLTNAVHAKIVAVLRGGNTIRAACWAAGISKSTFHRWVEKGEEEEEGIYRDFLDDVRAAEAEAEMGAVKMIQDDMLENVESAKWFLVHRHQDDWGGRGARGTTGRAAVLERTPPPDLGPLTPDEVKQWRDLLAKISDCI